MKTAWRLRDSEEGHRKATGRPQEGHRKATNFPQGQIGEGEN